MFKNLVTLVNGGASVFGRATASRFANKGAQVVLCDLPESNGEKIAKELGDNVQFIPADTSNEDDATEAVNSVMKTFGGVNVLVNCPELRNFGNKLKKNHADYLSDFMEMNLMSTYNMSRLVAGIMGGGQPDKNGLRGIIINTARLDGIHKTENRAAVTATFASIIGMTAPFACDVGHEGIRVVTIIPGLNETSSPEIQSFLKRNNILHAKQSTDAEGFAHLVQTVVSNPYINTTTIDLSGGLGQIFTCRN